MKKIHLTGKLMAFLCLIFIASSCMSGLEEAEEVQVTELPEEEISEIPESENLRKGRTFKYMEVFSNQITPISFPNENPEIPVKEVTFLPGTGKGVARFMGRATSYINQLATSETTSIGAPVTQFYGEELAKLGLKKIPDEVSSVTVDRRGNAIFFKSLENIATPINETLTIFVAEVEIVGGTGRFRGASGEGIVEGRFNPTNGKGSSVVKASLRF